MPGTKTRYLKRPKPLQPFILLLLLALLLPAMALAQHKKEDQLAAFDLIVSRISMNYCFLEHKRVNWDSLSEAYRTRLKRRKLKETEFFALTADMLQELHDPHIKLTSYNRRFISGRMPVVSNFKAKPYLKKRYDIYNPRLVKMKYIQGRLRNINKGNFKYGWLADSVAYVQFVTFHIYGWDYEIFQQISQMKGAKALVIDIRGNEGGRVLDDLIQQFADTNRLLAYARGRIAPPPILFDRPELYQATAPYYTWFKNKPVIILTDRYTASAAEVFANAFKVFPNARIIGDTTAGAVAISYEQKLPNGWRLELSNGIIYNWKGEILEDRGIWPDVQVSNTAGDIKRGNDKVLEKALAYLRSGEWHMQPDPASSRAYRISLTSQMHRVYRYDGIDAAVQFFKDHKEDTATYAWTQWDLNGLGYMILRRSSAGEALKIFQLNMEEFPWSYNTYDSMADAYYWANDHAQAVAWYRKAQEKNMRRFPADERAYRRIKNYIEWLSN